MKKIILIFFLIISINCLSKKIFAYDSRNIRVILYSYTQINKKGDLEHKQLSPVNLVTGHSFLLISNLGDEPIKVGRLYINESENVSIGLWAGSTPNVFNFFGSFFGSSSSSVPGAIYLPNGVYYDFEKYKFTCCETPMDLKVKTKYVSKEDFEKVNNHILSKENTYSLSFYNCSSFAVDCWNIITGENLKAGLVNTPFNLGLNLNLAGDEDKTFDNTYHYYKYNEYSGGMRTYA